MRAVLAKDIGMKCPRCERPVPADAQFCIYCAAPLASAAPAAPANAATGPTTRLNPQVVERYRMPATAPAPAPQMTMPRQRHRHGHRQNDSIGAVWLIGLGLLFLTGHFFPGILFLIGITSFLKHSGRGRDRKAVQTLVFFLGLTALFWYGFSLPLLLIWLGAMALLNRHW
jgi:hypothetical protein